MARRSFASLASALVPLVVLLCLPAPTLVAQAASASSGAPRTAVDSGAAGPGAHYVTPTRIDATAPPLPATAPKPAIVILAFVHADEVRFTAQPRIAVRVCGALDSARILARRNLPDPVVVGETYRDVFVAVEILGHLTTSDSSAVARAASPLRKP